MKKSLCVVLSVTVLSAMSLCACGSTVCQKDGMLQAMKEEQNISGEVQECGSVAVGDKVLFVGANESDGKIFDYCAAQFAEKGKDQYQYDRKISVSYEEGQVGICKWQDGYVIVCTNETARKFSAAITPKGKQTEVKEIDVDEIPFVYYMDMSEYEGGYDADYKFLDQDGVEIR